MKKFFKGIAAVLLIAMLAVMMFACGEPAEDDTGTDAGTTQAPVDDTVEATDPPTTTEAPTTTERTTPEPTEPPTDAADLPEPDENGVIAGARYYLESVNSQMFLNADGDFKYAGFTQEDYEEGSANQMFIFTRLESGNYLIRACGTKAGYLDVEDAENADGKRIEATETPNGATEDGVSSQEWILTPRADGSVTIASVISEGKKCIDVNAVSKNAGEYIHQWVGGTAANQKWIFHLVKDYVAPEPTEPAA